jgi:mycothiol synthase
MSGMLPPRSARSLAEPDLPALQALIGRCLDADGGLPDAASVAFARRMFLSGPGAAWRDDGDALIAAAALGPERDGRITAAGAVDPAFRGQGIGRRLLDWTVAAAAGRPLLIGTESLSKPAERLYARYGLHQVFAELVMRADLPGPVTGGLAQDRLPQDGRRQDGRRQDGRRQDGRPQDGRPQGGPLPAGLELRTWPGAEADFFAAYDASFRDRPGFPGWTMQEWLDWTADDEDFRPDLCLLAADQSGAPAGFVTVGGNWIVQAGVVPAWRRRGLGAALMQAAMTGIAAAGFGSCWLTVATNNPGAISLYRTLGFAETGCRARYAG